MNADYIVSNREVIPTYRDLLHFLNKKIAQLEKVYEPAASGYVMHLGVDKLYPQLAHHNFLFSNDSKRNYREVFHDKVLPQDPTIYLVNSNKSDASQALEGHKNAASHIIEGFSLGKAFHRCHLPVTQFEGQGFVSFRMYEAGFITIIEGWTKHLAVGASSTQPHIMILIILWMVGSITSYSGLTFSLFMKTLSFKRMALSYSLYTLLFIRLHRRVGRFSILFLSINPILFLFLF